MNEPAIVRAMVVNDGQILAFRNADDDPNTAHAGRWELPGGGIEPEEDPDQAIAREVREETGLEPQQVRRLERVDVTREERIGCLYYRVDVGSQDVTMSDEHAAFRWVDPDGFKRLEYYYASAYSIPVIERAAGDL